MNMALDLAKDHIRVNAICRGWVQTPLVNGWFEQRPDPAETPKYLFGAHPLGRIATTEEIRNAAVFLARNDSTFITVTALHLDAAITLEY